MSLFRLWNVYCLDSWLSGLVQVDVGTLKTLRGAIRKIAMYMMVAKSSTNFCNLNFCECCSVR